MLTEILISLFVGIGSSTLIIFLFKNWALKQLEHQFNKKIEDYKSELQKDNINFQIEKGEFSKKKFEQTGALYLQLLDRKNRARENYKLIAYRSFMDIRKSFDCDLELNKKLDDAITLASLYMNDEIIKEIKNFTTCCEMMMFNIVGIAEAEILKIPTQLPYLKYKVSTNDHFNQKDAFDSLNKLSKHMDISFGNITNQLKSYLSPN